MKTRCEMLERHLTEYIAENHLMDAAMTKIKLETLQMVVNKLEQLLTR